MTLRDDRGKIRPTETWNEQDFERASLILDTVLDGLGDPTRERQFRMCSTLCRHRAVTTPEADKLPEWWWTEIAHDIAGGPVELLWEKGLRPSLSTQPCKNPSWIPIDRNDPRLKFPQDCGRCESCIARAACHSRPMRRP